MIKCFMLLVLCVSFSGCQLPGAQARRDRYFRQLNAEALQLHKAGSPYSETLARYSGTNSFLAGQRVAAAKRPEHGWTENPAERWKLSGTARYHEQECGTLIQYCVVVAVPRGSGTSAAWVPNFAPGMWWDYLFFDKDERLFSVYRHFVD